MTTTVTWRIDHTKILTRGELAAVLATWAARRVDRRVPE